MTTSSILKQTSRNIAGQIGFIFSFCIILLGIFFPFNSIRAAEPLGNCATLNYKQIITTEAYCRGYMNDQYKFISWTLIPDQEQAAKDAANDPATTASNSNTPVWIKAFTPVWIKALLGIIGWAGYWVMRFMALVLWISGVLLNYVLHHTVVEWSANISQISGINIAWKFIRDLMNIAFIFLLVYYAIKLILGLESKGKIQGFIAGIVLASLLINFSLFFTKVIIDASNIATIGFYNSIIGNQPTEKVGLSDAYQQLLGLTDLYNQTSLAQFEQNAGGGSENSNMAVAIVGVMGSILFLIVSFVFFSIAIMFIIRFIILILLLMLSPVGFMGIALPGMKKNASQWWSTLLGQCLFGPVYMLMTWVILTLMKSPGFITFGGGANNQAVWAKLFLGQSQTDVTGKSAAIGLLLNFALVIGFTIASLTTAKKFANQGSNLIGKYTGMATAFAGGAIFGGAAVVGRNTLGRGAKIAADSKWLQRKSVEGGLGGWAARQTLKASDKTAAGSFDARRTWAAEKTAKTLDLDLGKGLPFNEKAGVGGFAAKQDQKDKAREKEADAMIKKYKNDPATLAKYFSRTTLAGKVLGTGPKASKFTDTTVADQQYLYEKMSARDRDVFEKELISQGQSDLVDKLRSKLPREEMLDAMIRRNKGNQAALATEVSAITQPADQQYIYEKMSARDRAALDAALASVPGGPALTSKLRSNMSVEEQEKTEKAEGEARAAERSGKTRAFIRQFAIGKLADIDPKTGVAYSTYYPDIAAAVKELKPSDARKLTNEARINPTIIPLLNVRHLGDLMSNGDLSDDQITKIKAHATPIQLAWINDPARVKDWTV